MPLVSIIIPCYNAAPWLEAALASCLAQTWTQREIIVVDDGSTDTSLAVARCFEARGVRVIAQPNRGASAARNAGIRASRGDLLQFLDADDILDPGKTAAQVERAGREPVGTVFTGRWGRFVDDPAKLEVHEANPLFADLSPADYLLRYASSDCMMQPDAWLVPRAIAEAAGPWDEKISLNDDGEYFTRIVARATRVAYCPAAVSRYRSNLPDSLGAQRRRRHLESAWRAVQSITHEIETLLPNAAGRTAAANLYQRFAYDYYPAAPDLMHAALAAARARGGATVAPLGGGSFQLLRRLVGWRVARRLQVMTGRFPAPAAE